MNPCFIAPLLHIYLFIRRSTLKDLLRHGHIKTTENNTRYLKVKTDICFRHKYKILSFHQCKKHILRCQKIHHKTLSKITKRCRQIWYSFLGEYCRASMYLSASSICTPPLPPPNANQSGGSTILRLRKEITVINE